MESTFGEKLRLLADELVKLATILQGDPVSSPMDAEDMTASPPRLLPVSGVLVAANPAVVRPVAFRAVHWAGGETDDGCSSSGSVLTLHEERLLLAEQRPSGHHSAPLLERQPRGASATRTAFHPACCKVPLFHQSMPHFDCKERAPSRASSDGGGSAMLDVLDSGHSSAALLAEEEAPSPSDSGVAELEAQLREKDAEIAHLRQTLERNEQAIIQVYEEKEQLWRRRLEDLRDHYEERLHMQRDVPAGQDGSPVAPAGAAAEAAGGGALQVSWLDTPQLDSEVAELTTLMEDSRLAGSDNSGDQVRLLRLELQHCRRQLQLALQGIEEERQHWQHERDQAIQFRRHLEASYWQVFNQNRELLRAVSHASEQLDGWYHSESSC